jgi:putative photosynthetic complex assembly protein 2
LFEIGLSVLFAILLWWVSTGVILYLDGLPARTFRWSLAIASAVGIVALVGLFAASMHATPTGAVAAFVCAILIWGWNEMAFLMGRITGPVRHPCPPDATGWRRFLLASETISHHELAVTLSAVVIGLVTWDQPNQIGFMTFAILWIMRLSTKLNIFLGAPNIADEFLPEHLAYLKTYFRRRPMNWLFPFAVTGATLLTAFLAHKAFQPGADEFQTVGFALLTALAALAVLEHWLLYVPLPPSALWGWGLKSHRRRRAAGADSHTTSWSRALERTCDTGELKAVLTAVADGRFGEVTHVAGAARLRDGWVRFEVANGCARVDRVPHCSPSDARVTATGRQFDQTRLGAAFEACAA